MAVLPTRERFQQLLNQAMELHIAKSTDYGDNLKVASQLGMTNLDGILLRISDKWERVKNLHRKRKAGEGGPLVKDESTVDTLRDIAAYCYLAILEVEDEQRERTSRIGYKHECKQDLSEE